MIIGDPYKFGFLIERVSDWEYPPFVNGLMFLYLNGKAYPEELRTTTFSTELPELLDEASPLVKPKENKKLFYLDSDERFEQLAALTYPENIDKENDLSYLVPFHEINDSGHAVFVLTDGENVLITAGEWSEGKLLPKNEYILPLSQYNKVVDGLRSFYDEMTPAKKPAKAKSKVTIHKIKKDGK